MREFNYGRHIFFRLQEGRWFGSDPTFNASVKKEGSHVYLHRPIQRLSLSLLTSTQLMTGYAINVRIIPLAETKKRNTKDKRYTEVFAWQVRKK